MASQHVDFIDLIGWPDSCSMVGMIEPTSGTGLSGIAGKSGKHVKSSLFAKLLAMLDKHAETSGLSKGEGLQPGASGLSKGKTGIAIADKDNPMVAAISKQLKALAAKEKSGDGTQAEETATPLVSSAAFIIDPATQSKKTDIIGAVASGLSGQKPSLNGGLPNPTLQAENKPVGSAETEGKQSILFGDKVQAAHAEASLQASVRPAVDSIQALITDAKAHQSKANAKTDSPIHTPSSAKAAADPIGQKSTHGIQLINPLAEKSDLLHKAETIQVAVGPRLQQSKTVQAPRDLNTRPVAQLNSQAGEKVDVAAAQMQQGKSVQTQQSLNSVASSGLSTTAAASFSDASLADSGSQFSDKGGREANSLSALSGEAKSSGSASAANFQSYLSQKASSSMTVFDSMQYIAQSAKNGQTRLEIQLEPAGLGKIQVTLQTDAAKQLQVHLVVDQSTTRQVIEQQLPTLRNALAQQGLDLSGFSMGSHKDDTSFGSNGQQQSNPFAHDSTTLSDANSVAQTQQATGNSSSRLSIHV